MSILFWTVLIVFNVAMLVVALALCECKEHGKEVDKERDL